VICNLDYASSRQANCRSTKMPAAEVAGCFSFGSLFAGIGGIDLGLERAGMVCEWQVEIDDYATKVLEKHWPGVTRFRDVRECGAHNLETVDLICGGFPCQDVSLAGKRAGLQGKRTTLWSEFARLIRELRPRWVLAENVPGLYSSDSGRFFGRVLRDLAESGYDAEWDCIPAAAVGAPHRRYRVFIVAHAQVGQDHERERGNVEETPSGGQGVHATADAGSEDVAYTQGEQSHTGQLFRGAEAIAQMQSGRLGGNADWWAVEPALRRVAHGVPSRVDRLRCLGNAVVPQVAEWIGRRIIEAASR